MPSGRGVILDKRNDERLFQPLYKLSMVFIESPLTLSFFFLFLFCYGFGWR